MNYNFTSLPYEKTSSFSQIVIDYLNGNENLNSFFQHIPSEEGIKRAIQEREKFNINRNELVKGLYTQYEITDIPEAVKNNIDKLKNNNTYTVCTAHQPALFTGPLYFIYKILHTIKLADSLKQLHQNSDFVPVFFMGSEDADADELCHFFLGKDKIIWNSGQNGAVGRMKNKDLNKIIDRIEQELSVNEFGKEISEVLKSSFLHEENIQTGTFRFLNKLFGKYGLIVYIPDNKIFKAQMKEVFTDDLLNHNAAKLVNNTIVELQKNYKVQANPREINLFYLKDDKRERIEKSGEHWYVLNTDIRFSKDELLRELEEYPENFSPNVILRGLMQEMTLPNLAFIGGGGELAYWLELKTVFQKYSVPFPVLILRNSFLLIEKKWNDLRKKLNIDLNEIFLPVNELENKKLIEKSEHILTLEKEKSVLGNFYQKLSEKSAIIDPGLKAHVLAIGSEGEKKLNKLEKKLIRAGKLNNEALIRQVRKLKEALFPLGGLQERVENFLPYYSKYGPGFIDMIYNSSLTTEQEFGIIEIEENF